jgi:cytochrome c oxidase subunit 1
MWGGDIRLRVPMLFSIGFIAMFIIGGLSGVTHAIVPSDYQQTDTYYIVAHFHYVLFGGALFGIFAGVYYWWPKMFGRMLSDRIGKWHFWAMLLGFNLTFAPFHILGLQGMPRRVYRYSSGFGWDVWNLVSTVGAFLIALSVLVFLYNVITSLRNGEVAGDDPWDGRTLEWAIPSPPPPHNFDEIPVVRSVDPFWHQKYAEDEHGRLVPAVAGGSNGHGESSPDESGEHGGHGGHGIHMPSPSYFPLIAALGLPIAAYGVMYSTIIAIDGAILLAVGLFGWAVEPSAE